MRTDARADDAPADAPAAISGYRTVGVQRYRETVGFFYDDLTVGDVFEHRPGRTITEMDNVLISMLGMNAAPLHIDAAYAEQTRWGKPIVSSLVTLAVVGGMSARSTSGLAVANLGVDHIRLTMPVFAGDTLYATSEILGKRLSRSHPGHGIVTCRTVGTKSTGEEVLSLERTFLLPTRDAGLPGQVPY
ncbi:MaoC family dehydratase [Dactylosporangium fulvum]|uniref:MaoC family dehydratase n=1 Tax=Dactylosporangium fulvum TaxID=53359 RepID=A0ABY5VVS6_9ACTN|nr:MaoC family dehydratase [Dactylosporangium fulvum]UWP79886.1 MaoC family dehydratase [Dactylosporangium fulvum]